MRHSWMTALASLALLGFAGALSAAATTIADRTVEEQGRQQMIDSSYALAQLLRR